MDNPTRESQSQTPPLPQLCTVSEVAEWLSLSKRTIYEEIRRGALPGVVRVGRRILFDRVRLESWVAGKTGAQ